MGCMSPFLLGRRGTGTTAGIPPRLLSALTRAGEPGRIFAPIVDLGVALGPAEVLRQYRGARRNVVEATGDVYREVWSRAAAELGAEVIDLGHSILAIKRAGVATLTWVHEVQLDDVVVLRAAADKPLVHRLLTAADIPVPAFVEVSANTIDAALPFVRAAATGCVVKPAADTGVGAAVTGGIRNRRDLHRAAARVSRFGSRVLVERFLPGRMYRVNILDGQVLGIVERRAPTVLGDGQRSVAALVAAENARRLGDSSQFGTNWLRVDLDCLLSLADQDLTLTSVPAAGRPVRVKFATNQNCRAENDDVPVDAAIAIAELARRAAAVVGLRFVGVDVLAADLMDGDAVVLEVNGSPTVKLHGNVGNMAGAGVDLAARIAVPVLRTALEEASRREFRTVVGD